MTQMASSGVRNISYRTYTRYARSLTQRPLDQVARFPSVFLQRYASVWDGKSGTERPLVLEPWQVYAVDDLAGQAIWVKPRQVGFSFLRAARALARALLTPNYIAVFISYNRDEAKNKIIYARQLYDSINFPGKSTLLSDTMAELRFSNGARIISLPAKAVRGYPNPDVFGDEWAFVPKAFDIYSGTLSSGVRGGGLFTIASTPYGESNHFHSVYVNESDEYPEFGRHRLEWWYSPAMCRNVPEALHLAPGMSTEQRVFAYGTKKLISIFRGLPLEDFQREHECSFAARDDTVISRARLSLTTEWAEKETPEGEETDPDLERFTAVVKNWKAPGSAVLEREIVPALRLALDAMHPRSTFTAGYDVGLSGDGSYLTVFEERPDGPRLQRVGFALHQMDWPEQERLLLTVAGERKCRKLFIDKAGIGSKLASDVRRRFVTEGTPEHEGRVVGVDTQVAWQRNQALYAVTRAVENLDVTLYPTEDLYRHFAAFKRASDPEDALRDRMILLRGKNKDGSQHHAEIVMSMGLALWDYTERTGEKGVPRADRGDVDRSRRRSRAGRIYSAPQAIIHQHAPSGWVQGGGGLWVPA